MRLEPNGEAAPATAQRSPLQNEARRLFAAPVVVAPASEVVTQQAAMSAAAQVERDAGVTWRVVVPSLLLALGFGYVIPIIDLQFCNIYLGAGHLPPVR